MGTCRGNARGEDRPIQLCMSNTSSKVTVFMASLCFTANTIETGLIYELLSRQNSASSNSMENAPTNASELIQVGLEQEGRGAEMHRRDPGFLSKQGRKIPRSILGSSIQEDPRKRAKRR